MSKWINKQLFEKYVENKEKEQVETNKSFIRKSDVVWANPTAGSVTQAEIYEGRFLPDPENVYSSKYFYHMWKAGEKWNYVFCPKTWDFNNYCPICALTNKLYMGTVKDKSVAGLMKRKSRHVANFYVVSDPRDSKIVDLEKKASGKTKIYEFPDKVESKLKMQLLDKNEGLGSQIFDPGEEGHNFILRIKSTKTDANGKSYPDYADCDFSRKSSAIGTEKQIKDIMDTRYNLITYIKGLETPRETIVEMLRSEMLYDLVKDEWEKHSPSVKLNTKQDVADDVPDHGDGNDVKSTPPNKVDDSDDDLLRELENMK